MQAKPESTGRKLRNRNRNRQSRKNNDNIELNSGTSATPSGTEMGTVSNNDKDNSENTTPLYEYGPEVLINPSTNRPIVKKKDPIMSFWCEFCNCQLSSDVDAIQHLTGKAHNRKKDVERALNALKTAAEVSNNSSGAPAIANVDINYNRETGQKRKGENLSNFSPLPAFRERFNKNFNPSFDSFTSAQHHQRTQQPYSEIGKNWMRAAGSTMQSVLNHSGNIADRSSYGDRNNMSFNNARVQEYGSFDDDERRSWRANLYPSSAAYNRFYTN